MKLYHYSKEKYNILKTKARQLDIREASESFSIRSLPYDRHVSFFTEQPPFDLFESIYGTAHPFWKPGNIIYEHLVDLKDLPKDFFYLLVESAEVTKLYYDPASDRLSNEDYVNKKIDILTKNRYYGTNLHDLQTVIMKVRGKIRSSYAALPERPNFDQIKDKYAPAVPHLMIYSNIGSFKVSGVSKITIPRKEVYKRW
jgi:hypothetical protein